MRELARGQFMVKSKDMTLLDCIRINQLVSPEAHVYTHVHHKCFVFRGVWNSLQGQTENVE